MDTILFAGLCLILLLIIFLIVKFFQLEKSNRSVEVSEEIRAEFARSRADASRADEQIRGEMNRALSAISEKLEAQMKSSLEREIQLNQLISSSLAEIQQKNAEQSEKQTAALELQTKTMMERESQLKQSITASLSEIQQKNTEQSEKQAKALETQTKAMLESEMQLNQRIANSLSEIQQKNAEQSEKQMSALERALRVMRTENEKKLEQMRETVSEKLDSTLAKRLDASFETVAKQLENLYKSLGEMRELSTGVTENVSALNRVLTNVKARGTWAEVQLKGILDQIIPGRYVENYSPANGVVVEFAVMIPSGEGHTVYLPLDSKFPIEDYIRLTEAADAADAAALAAARKTLSRRITEEAKSISEKYIHVPETTPFAIMYLATEGLYAEAVSLSGLADKLHTEYRVMLAGPSTVTALLNSLAMGFQTLAVNEKAEEIRVMLSAVKSQYEKFGGLLEKAKKKVNEAGTVLDQAQSRSNMIRRKLGGVDALPSDNADQLLFGNDSLSE